MGGRLRPGPAAARSRVTGSGHEPGMTANGPDADRVRRRAADLTPEELAAGSDDPQAQAAAILADSDERTEHPGAAPDTVLEERTSQDAAEAP